MRIDTKQRDFLHYLKDERFIEWKLIPSDEMNSFWEEYLRENPDERKNVELAEKHFRRIDISSLSISQNQRSEGANHLKQALEEYRRKYITLRFSLAAAGVAVLVIATFLFQKIINIDKQNEIALTNYVVGSAQDSKEILFTTGNKTISFQHNVDIEMENNKIAHIKGEDEDLDKISIEQHSMNRLVVPYGKRSKIILSDGTKVWLNSGSTLEFPATFSAERRDVYLTGEIFIEVATVESSTFYVHTADYDVKVYGTKFNVSAYSGTTSSVVLVEGNVALQTDGKQEISLSPNEQAIYSQNGSFETKQVDVQSFISWREGYLTFDDTPMTEALKQIERYYNFSFNYSDDVSFKGLTCTGKIILSDNLDNVMTALTLISGTKYKKDNNLIIIYNK